MTIGNRIRQVRESKGIKQSVIAAALNMSQANYCKIENEGTKIKLVTLQQIADFLQMDATALIRSIGQPNSVPLPASDSVNSTHLATVDRELFTLLLAVQGDAIHSKDALLRKQEQELIWLREENARLQEGKARG